jgi:ribosome biogenesis protein MAK21
MKTIIIREMTALIMRPSPPSTLSTASHSQPNLHIRFPSGQRSAPKREKNVWHAHAQYYATITFNQIVLSTSEADRAAARMLIDTYFQLFREVVGERGPESVDGAVPIAADIEVKRNEKNHKEPRTRGGKRKEVRGAAGFAEVQDENAKLLGAVLTGINRALPYAQFGGGNVQ